MTRHGLLKGTTIIVVGMLAGRATGLLREMILASLFGLTRQGDLATLLLSIPDLLTGLLIGSAVSAVLVPEYQALEQHEGGAVANQLLGQSLMVIGGAASLAAGVLAMSQRLWLPLLAPGFDANVQQQTSYLLPIVLLAFPLCALTAVTAAACQIGKRIGVIASGTLLFNGVVMGGLVLSAGGERMATLAWGVVVAAFVRLGSQAWVANRAGFWRGGFVAAFSGNRLTKAILQRYVQALATIGLTILVPTMIRAFASNMPGDMALVSYALKLIELPTGLCGTVLSLLIFSRLSELATRGSHDEQQRFFSRAFWSIAGITLAGTAAMQIVIRPLCALLFQRGQISELETVRIADLAFVALASVPAMVLVTFAVAACHARRDTRLPLVLSVMMTLVQLVASSFFFPTGGTNSLMVVLVVVSWLHATALFGAIHVRHRLSVVGRVTTRWVGEPAA